MSDTAAILACFAAGAVGAHFGLLPDILLARDWSLPALWVFMGVTGIMLGRDRKTGELFKSVNPAILLLPVATTIGTFAGCALCVAVVALGFYECLAMGAGFAYYSLSSIFISRELGPEAGAIALLANVFRELLTIIFAGFLSRFFGPQAIVSCGGAASMDTILGVVMRHGGPRWVAPALVNGVALDFSVPFWTALFCSLAKMA